ncbi:MAG TPA: DUF2634 domain-containing protein [Candidatus Faecivivens stercorigallinarum]|nr:DUF2634 domain-containing protein [Candidatus Faecivivens stercorigallinarum]
MSILSLLPVIEGGASRKMGDVTWNLDEMSGTKISGLDSLCQAIRAMLEVPRYRYPIYSWQYGSELDTLIGSGFSDVQQKAPTMIRDALLRDDRIDEVDSFTVSRTQQRDAADITFTVHSRLGNIEAYWTVETSS